MGSLDLNAGVAMDVEYSSSFGKEELQLLEVDEKLLQEVLSNRVQIKGSPDDEAVLCTTKKTYAVKFVGTTNTVLLIPREESPARPLSAPAAEAPAEEVQRSQPEESAGSPLSVSVTATASGHLELVEIAPKLEKLKGLLEERRYTAAEEMQAEETSTSNCSNLYTLSDLESKLQASQAEILTGLQNLGAIEIAGKWRLVDEIYQKTLLEVLLCTAAENGWPLDRFPGKEMVSAVEKDGFPRENVEHCLRLCAKKLEEEMNIDSEPNSVNGLWALDASAVCLHRARQLLNAATKWYLDDFMEAWKADVPPGLLPDMKMLKGEVLVEISGGRPWIKKFRASDLPFEPSERFSAIFAERPKWQLDDLAPYIKDLKIPGKTSEALLLKYTRMSQASPQEPPVYSAR